MQISRNRAFQSLLDLLASSICTSVSTIGGTDLNKKVSALDPIDVLNHKIRTAACKLSWAVYNLVQAHGGGNLERRSWPIALCARISITTSLKEMNLHGSAEHSQQIRLDPAHDILHYRKLDHVALP